MSDAANPLPMAETPAWPMYRALVGVGVLCALLIVLVFEGTKPIIRANQIAAREQAIFLVLDGAVRAGTFRVTDQGFEPASPDANGELVFAGYDASGELIGVALEAAGMGYQDTVRLLYGYRFDQQAIVGIQVLESRETPGLGTRIETDPDFLENFVRLDVSLDASGEDLANPITAVKEGEKTEPWEVDCITGATVTSQAVVSILDQSASTWMPRLSGQRSAFAQREE